MHEFAEKLIKERIKKLADAYDFNVRRMTNPEECPFYTNGGRCHDIEDMNCLLCLCPNYDRTVKEGGCKINSPDGKYTETVDGKIWDCSDCDFPHKKENVIKVLEKIFN